MSQISQQMRIINGQKVLCNVTTENTVIQVPVCDVFGRLVAEFKIIPKEISVEPIISSPYAIGYVEPIVSSPYAIGYVDPMYSGMISIGSSTPMFFFTRPPSPTYRTPFGEDRYMPSFASSMESSRPRDWYLDPSLKKHADANPMDDSLKVRGTGRHRY
jgi:hypothetical protein